MAQPELNAAGEWIYDRLSPWAAYDSDATGWPVAVICRALGVIADEIFTASEMGLDALDDPDTAPAWYLPHLAMKAGVQLAAGWTEEQMRDAIRTRPAERRGTPAAIIAAAQATLTGDKTVVLREKDGGAYQLTVVTRTAETPDPAVTLAALTAAKPVGIILTHTVVDGWTYSELADAYTGQDYDDLAGDFASYADLADNAP